MELPNRSNTVKLRVLLAPTFLILLLVLSCSAGGIAGMYQMDGNSSVWLDLRRDGSCSQFMSATGGKPPRMESGLPMAAIINSGSYEITGNDITWNCASILFKEKATLQGRIIVDDQGRRWVKK